MSGYPGANARAKRNKQMKLDQQLQQQHAQQQNAYCYPPQPVPQQQQDTIMREFQQAVVHPNGQAVIANPYQTQYHPSSIIQPVPQNQYQPINQQAFVQQNQNPRPIVHNPYTQSQPAMYQQRSQKVTVHPPAQYPQNYPQQVHAQQPIYNNGNQQPNVQPPPQMYVNQNQTPSQYQAMKAKYQDSGGFAQPNQQQQQYNDYAQQPQSRYQAQPQPNHLQPQYNNSKPQATNQRFAEEEGQGPPAFNPYYQSAAAQQSDSSSNQGVFNDQTSDMSNASAPPMYPDVKKNPYY